MAPILKKKLKSGKEVYSIHFKKPSSNKDKKWDTYSATFDSLEEAKEFAKKWEYIFHTKGEEYIEYDRKVKNLERRLK